MRPVKTLLFTLFLAVTSNAQNTGAGTPAFGSFTGGTPFDRVNNQNINVHLAIPFIGLAGRGTNFSFSEINDSQIWIPVNSGGTVSWTPVVDSNGNPMWGWQTASPTGSISQVLTATSGTCLVTLPSGIQVNVPLFRRNDWVYTDTQGTQHRFPTVDVTDTCINNTIVEQATSGFNVTGYASDPSGYLLNANIITNFPSGFTPIAAVTGVVTDATGVQHYGVNWEGYVEDTNGNFISTTTTNSGHIWTDTTGTNALTVVTMSGSVQYKDRNGTVIATINLQTLNIKSNFGCSGVVEYSGTATVPASIGFPNSQTISFSYEPTPGNTGYYTGRLQKVTLPNGGFYEYDYGTANDGINCNDGTTVNLTRKINDGTNTQVWSFSRSGSTTTVTAPQLAYDSFGNDTVYTFDANGHETSRKIYEGSASSGSLLRKINTTWASNGTPGTVVTILEDGNTQAETDTTYDSNGVLQSTTAYDFGSRAHGPLIKTVSTTYLASNNSNYAAPRNLINLVSEIKVQDANGIKSRDQFRYDENPLPQNACPTGVAQHDDANYGCSFSFRGNTTSVVAYKDPVTPANPITKSFTYDIFGNTLTAQVNCCQQKTWVYSATTNYSYPDSVTSGVSGGPQLTQNYTYNAPTDGPPGLLKTQTDENGQTTQYHYDLVGRLAILTRPDNTQISYSYDDTNHITTTTTPIDSSHSAKIIRAADALGRLATTTTQDSGNTVTPSSVQNQYDEMGRLSGISNPYTGSSPSFFSTTQFDALGRPTKTIVPDGQQSTYSYSLQSVKVTDPTGRQIKRKLDAAGRLIEVDEPNTSLVGGGATASVTISGSLNSTTTMGSASVIAATNSALTSFVASDGSSHTFYLDNNRHVNHVFWNSSGGWQVQDVSAAANNALAASGSSMSSFASIDGNYHAFYLDTNNHVNHLSGSGVTWSNQDVTGAAGATVAASNSKLTSFTNSAGNHVYFLGTNQHEYQLYWNGSQWLSQDLTALAGTTHLPAAGSSLTGFSLSDGTEHTFYLGTDQHVYQMLWTGSAYQNQDLTIINALDLVDGPCAFEGDTCFGTSTPQSIAFGANGAYLSITAPGNISCTPSTFGGDPNPGASEACYLMNSFTVAAAGTAMTSFLDSNGAHVYYLDSHGHNHHLFWPGSTQSSGGPWTDQDQTSISSPVVVASSGSALAGFPTSADGKAHVVFLGTQQHVYQTVYVGSQLQNQDLTSLSSAAVAPVAGSALTAFGLSAGNPAHIQYLDSSGHVNHLYFDGSAWHNQDLNSLTSGTITVFDSGSVSLSAAGFTATACFGASSNPACTGQQGNNSASQVASALAQSLNGAGSPVSASTLGATITLTSNGTLASSSVTALSTTHDNSTLFTTPSFTSPATSLTGGGDPSPDVTPYVTTYTYNVLDQITTISQGAQTRTINYDALGRETSEITPEAGTVSFVHNDFDLATRRTDNRGVVTTYNYDQLNRLTGKSYPTVPAGVTTMPNNICDPTSPTGTNLIANTCFYYDQGGSAAFAEGRITEVVDPSGSETYTYDQLGRVTQKSKVINGTNGGNPYVIKYQFNLANEITQIQYPSGRQVKPSFDALGRMSGITDTNGGTDTTYASGVQYNTANQMTGLTYGNGVIAAYGYSNDRLQMTSVSYVKGGTTLFGLSFGYSQNEGNSGQITGITDSVDSGRSINFAYDALGRLQQASTAGSANFPKWDLAFGYDRYGNRLSETPLADTSPNASVPWNLVTVDAATNHISTSGYSYDAAGNMTNDGVNTLAYDGENRASNSSGLGGTAAYIYDAAGVRVRKCAPNCTSPTSSTTYIFSGNSVIAEYDDAASSSPSREYVNSPQGLLATIDSSGTQYHLRDHLSIRVTTDANGSKIGEQGHFPFGESWYRINSGSKWAFTSYERDVESGNDYAQARYYINRLGRFNSSDPVSGSSTLPSSMNRYVYVANDPANLIDPLGLEEGPPVLKCVIDDTVFFGEFCELILEELFGGGGLPGGPEVGGGGKPPKVDFKALADCIFDIFRVLMTSFSPSLAGEGARAGQPIGVQNGSFSGIGFDARQGSIGPPTWGITNITVTNDLSHSTTWIEENSKDSPYTDPRGPLEHTTGFTDWTHPYVNYTDGSLVSQDTVLATQIWELGNSLSSITGVQFPGKLKNPTQDPGARLFDCYNQRSGWNYEF